MALAVISTAFTAFIAVAFDRRYGALKRLGATRCRFGDHRRKSLAEGHEKRTKTRCA